MGILFQHHIELYIKPQYRIGPYIIGILLGYYLAKYQRVAVKPTRSRSFVGECLSAFTISWLWFPWFCRIDLVISAVANMVRLRDKEMER